MRYLQARSAQDISSSTDVPKSAGKNGQYLSSMRADIEQEGNKTGKFSPTPISRLAE
jgi:hypothetical protein